MRKLMFITIATTSASVLTAATLAVFPEKTPVVPHPVEAPPAIEMDYVCKGCDLNENLTLSFLQLRGIRDKAALATVMGNIKQESKFIPNICEGGARVSYTECKSGGYGLIQWTSTNRYRGLGNFVNKYGGDPSTLPTQLRYMVNEPQWTRYELYLKSENQSIDFYMTHAYKWLGWGIHGKRTTYSYQYYSQLTKPVSNVA